MSGICSRHHPSLGPIVGCAACNADVEDLFGKEATDAARTRAEAAGQRICEKCGFKHYKTINYCPLCYKIWDMQEN